MSGDGQTAKLAGRRPLDGGVCAQHGRELIGCKSPVGVPTWTHREHGQPRAEGKGETARDRPKEAGVQEVRGDELQTAYKAEGCEASWHMAAKPTGTRLAGRAGPEARPFARHCERWSGTASIRW